MLSRRRTDVPAHHLEFLFSAYHGLRKQVYILLYNIYYIIIYKSIIHSISVRLLIFCNGAPVRRYAVHFDV